MQGKVMIIVLALSTAAAAARAEVKSDFDRHYDFTRLRTFNFQPQVRSVRDPLGSNSLWDGEVKDELAQQLVERGFVEDAGENNADFLVAYYMRTHQKEELRAIDDGGVWNRHRWPRSGWGRDVTVWEVPFTEATLVVDVIDAKTKQLVWRGYDIWPLDLDKAGKSIVDAVDELVERLAKQSRRA